MRAACWAARWLDGREDGWWRGLGEELFYFGVDGAAFGAAGELFGGDAHYAAHFFHGGGACAGYDFAEGGGELFVGELFGHVFFDDGCLEEFGLGEFGAVLLGVDCG